MESDEEQWIQKYAYTVPSDSSFKSPIESDYKERSSQLESDENWVSPISDSSAESTPRIRINLETKDPDQRPKNPKQTKCSESKKESKTLPKANRKSSNEGKVKEGMFNRSQRIAKAGEVSSKATRRNKILSLPIGCRLDSDEEVESVETTSIIDTIPGQEEPNVCTFSRRVKQTICHPKHPTDPKHSKDVSHPGNNSTRKEIISSVSCTSAESFTASRTVEISNVNGVSYIDQSTQFNTESCGPERKAAVTEVPVVKGRDFVEMYLKYGINPSRNSLLSENDQRQDQKPDSECNKHRDKSIPTVMTERFGAAGISGQNNLEKENFPELSRSDVMDFISQMEAGKAIIDDCSENTGFVSPENSTDYYTIESSSSYENKQVEAKREENSHKVTSHKTSVMPDKNKTALGGVNQMISEEESGYSSQPSFCSDATITQRKSNPATKETTVDSHKRNKETSIPVQSVSGTFIVKNTKDNSLSTEEMNTLVQVLTGEPKVSKLSKETKQPNNPIIVQNSPSLPADQNVKPTSCISSDHPQEAAKEKTWTKNQRVHTWKEVVTNDISDGSEILNNVLEDLHKQKVAFQHKLEKEPGTGSKVQSSKDGSISKENNVNSKYTDHNGVNHHTHVPESVKINQKSDFKSNGDLEVKDKKGKLGIDKSDNLQKSIDPSKHSVGVNTDVNKNLPHESIAGKETPGASHSSQIQDYKDKSTTPSIKPQTTSVIGHPIEAVNQDVKNKQQIPPIDLSGIHLSSKEPEHRAIVERRPPWQSAALVSDKPKTLIPKRRNEIDNFSNFTEELSRVMEMRKKRIARLAKNTQDDTIFNDNIRRPNPSGNIVESHNCKNGETSNASPDGNDDYKNCYEKRRSIFAQEVSEKQLAEYSPRTRYRIEQLVEETEEIAELKAKYRRLREMRRSQYKTETEVGIQDSGHDKKSRETILKQTTESKAKDLSPKDETKQLMKAQILDSSKCLKEIRQETDTCTEIILDDLEIEETSHTETVSMDLPLSDAVRKVCPNGIHSQTVQDISSEYPKRNPEHDKITINPNTEKATTKFESRDKENQAMNLKLNTKPISPSSSQDPSNIREREIKGNDNREDFSGSFKFNEEFAYRNDKVLDDTTNELRSSSLFVNTSNTVSEIFRNGTDNDLCQFRDAVGTLQTRLHTQANRHNDVKTLHMDLQTALGDGPLQSIRPQIIQVCSVLGAQSSSKQERSATQKPPGLSIKLDEPSTSKATSSGQTTEKISEQVSVNSLVNTVPGVKNTSEVEENKPKITVSEGPQIQRRPLSTNEKNMDIKLNTSNQNGIESIRIVQSEPARPESEPKSRDSAQPINSDPNTHTVPKISSPCNDLSLFPNSGFAMNYIQWYQGMGTNESIQRKTLTNIAKKLLEIANDQNVFVCEVVIFKKWDDKRTNHKQEVLGQQAFQVSKTKDVPNIKRVFVNFEPSKTKKVIFQGTEEPIPQKVEIPGGQTNNKMEITIAVPQLSKAEIESVDTLSPNREIVYPKQKPSQGTVTSPGKKSEGNLKSINTTPTNASETNGYSQARAQPRIFVKDPEGTVTERPFDATSCIDEVTKSSDNKNRQFLHVPAPSPSENVDKYITNKYNSVSVSVKTKDKSPEDKQKEKTQLSKSLVCSQESYIKYIQKCIKSEKGGSDQNEDKNQTETKAPLKEQKDPTTSVSESKLFVDYIKQSKSSSSFAKSDQTVKPPSSKESTLERNELNPRGIERTVSSFLTTPTQSQEGACKLTVATKSQKPLEREKIKSDNTESSSLRATEETSVCSKEAFNSYVYKRIKNESKYKTEMAPTTKPDMDKNPGREQTGTDALSRSEEKMFIDLIKEMKSPNLGEIDSDKGNNLTVRKVHDYLQSIRSYTEENALHADTEQQQQSITPSENPVRENVKSILVQGDSSQQQSNEQVTSSKSVGYHKVTLTKSKSSPTENDTLPANRKAKRLILPTKIEEHKQDGNTAQSQATEKQDASSSKTTDICKDASQDSTKSQKERKYDSLAATMHEYLKAVLDNYDKNIHPKLPENHAASLSKVQKYLEAVLSDEGSSTHEKKKTDGLLSKMCNYLKAVIQEATTSNPDEKVMEAICVSEPQDCIKTVPTDRKTFSAKVVGLDNPNKPLMSTTNEFSPIGSEDPNLVTAANETKRKYNQRQRIRSPVGRGAVACPSSSDEAVNRQSRESWIARKHRVSPKEKEVNDTNIGTPVSSNAPTKESPQTSKIKPVDSMKMSDIGIGISKTGSLSGYLADTESSHASFKHLAKNATTEQGRSAVSSLTGQNFPKTHEQIQAKISQGIRDKMDNYVNFIDQTLRNDFKTFDRQDENGWKNKSENQRGESTTVSASNLSSRAPSPHFFTDEFALAPNSFPKIKPYYGHTRNPGVTIPTRESSAQTVEKNFLNTDNTARESSAMSSNESTTQTVHVSNGDSRKVSSSNTIQTNDTSRIVAETVPAQTDKLNSDVFSPNTVSNTLKTVGSCGFTANKAHASNESGAETSPQNSGRTTPQNNRVNIKPILQKSVTRIFLSPSGNQINEVHKYQQQVEESVKKSAKSPITEKNANSDYYKESLKTSKICSCGDEALSTQALALALNEVIRDEKLLKTTTNQPVQLPLQRFNVTRQGRFIRFKEKSPEGSGLDIEFDFRLPEMLRKIGNPETTKRDLENMNKQLLEKYKPTLEKLTESTGLTYKNVHELIQAKHEVKCALCKYSK